MNSTYILTVFFVAIILLLLLVSKFKVHASMSMLLVTIFLAVAIKTPLNEVPKLINEGFGNTAKNVALVIFLGSVLGEILSKTGAAIKITNTFIKWFGQKKVLWAIALSCFIMGIPIFPDTIGLLLIPICSNISVTTGLSMMQFAAVIQVGVITSSLVPPTPGPVAAASILGLSLGEVIPWGILVAIPGAIVNVLWAKSIKKYIEPKDEFITDVDKLENIPNFGKSIIPLIIPIFLILIDNVVGVLYPETRINEITSFVGNPLSALLIGVFMAMFLQIEKFWQKKEYRNDIFENALIGSVVPIFITCLGGSLGSFIKNSGVADIIAQKVVESSIAPIFVPMLISILIRIITGSNTLALTTTSALVAPMLSTLGITPLAAFLATGSGGIIFSHANSSGLWLNTTLCNMSFDQGLKSIGIATLLSGLGCCAMTLILYFLGFI